MECAQNAQKNQKTCYSVTVTRNGGEDEREVDELWGLSGFLSV